MCYEPCLLLAKGLHDYHPEPSLGVDLDVG